MMAGAFVVADRVALNDLTQHKQRSTHLIRIIFNRVRRLESPEKADFLATLVYVIRI